MAASTAVFVKPTYLAALTDKTGRVGREWLPWFQSVGVNAQAVIALQTALAALQASLAAGTASASTLAAQVAALSAALATVEAEIAALQTSTSATAATVQYQTLQINTLIAELAAVGSGLGYVPLNPANNLSDVDNAATARFNLGITTGGSSNESVMVNFVTCSDDYSWSVNQPKQITVNGV